MLPSHASKHAGRIPANMHQDTACLEARHAIAHAVLAGSRSCFRPFAPHSRPFSATAPPHHSSAPPLRAQQSQHSLPDSATHCNLYCSSHFNCCLCQPCPDHVACTRGTPRCAAASNPYTPLIATHATAIAAPGRTPTDLPAVMDCQTTAGRTNAALSTQWYSLLKWHKSDAEIAGPEGQGCFHLAGAGQLLNQFLQAAHNSTEQHALVSARSVHSTWQCTTMPHTPALAADNFCAQHPACMQCCRVAAATRC